MSKVIGWKATIELKWEDGTVEKLEDHDFSDDLIGQIDYEISDYEESVSNIKNVDDWVCSGGNLTGGTPPYITRKWGKDNND